MSKNIDLFLDICYSKFRNKRLFYNVKGELCMGDTKNTVKEQDFQNILTEYKAMLKEQSDYLKKYRCGKRSG